MSKRFLNGLPRLAAESLLEMLVVGRVVSRDRNREASMIATEFAGGEGLALHHSHLVPVLMDTVMHNVVDSGLGTEIARFELFHRD